jgi:hypothetical protein
MSPSPCPKITQKLNAKLLRQLIVYHSKLSLISRKLRVDLTCLTTAFGTAGQVDNPYLNANLTVVSLILQQRSALCQFIGYFDKAGASINRSQIGIAANSILEEAHRSPCSTSSLRTIPSQIDLLWLLSSGPYPPVLATATVLYAYGPWN